MKHFDDESTFEKIPRRAQRKSLSMPTINHFGLCNRNGEKKSFSKKSAKNTAKALMEKHGINYPLRVYHCPGTDHYHLTSMTRDDYNKYGKGN